MSLVALDDVSRGIVKKILREPRRVVELARLFPEGDAVQQALDILTTESPAGKH